MVLISILFVFSISFFLAWYFSALSEQFFEEDEVIYYRSHQRKTSVSRVVSEERRYNDKHKTRAKSA